MKKIILGLFAVVLNTMVYSQPSQMRFWSLAGRCMEFNAGGPISLSPLAPGPGTCSPYLNANNYTNCHNITYDNNGRILFFIVDGKVYSGTGDLIGSLTDEVTNPDKFKGVDDYAIAKDPTCEGRYYIFFAGQGTVSTYINSLPYYAHLDLNLTNSQSNTTSNCMGIGKLTDIGGATAFAMPNAGGAFSEHAASVQFAISKPINTSNERFVFVKSTLGFSRFKITNGNGVIYDNYTRMFPHPSNASVQGSSQARGETELVSIGTGYRLACTYILLDINPSNAGNKIFISDLDASGTETSSRVVSLYTSPSDPLMPTGLEFSPSGDNLYFTHTTYASANTFTSFAINYYSYSANTSTSNIINNLPGVVSGVADLYSASQIELGYDGKLYFVKGDGMASFSSPDAPSSGIWNPNAFSFTSAGFTYPKSTVGLPSTSIKHIYILPDQIDGETYSDHVFDAINYTAPVTTTTWSYGINNNPWNATSAVKVSGALTIPTGANITIQDMSFEFAEGASIQIKNLATFKIDRSTLRALSCGVMWEGINVLNGGKLYMGKYGSTSTNQSKIFDAIQAINLTGNSAFLEVIDASLFDKNERHILITNGNGNLIKIQNNLFRHVLQLADQTIGMPDPTPNSTVHYGISSIEIRGSGLGINNQIIIGNPTPNSTDVNEMRRGQYGIIVENSNVDVIHNKFSDIFNTALHVDQQFNSNRTVKVTNFNTFDAQSNPNYMPYGIYARNGSNMTILWNYFDHFQYGSTCIYMTNNANRNLYANYNNFNSNNQAAFHVKSYNNGGASSVLQVEGNLIVGGGQSVAVDVTESILSATNTFSSLTILNNTITGVGLGINLLNIRGLGHTATVNSPGYNASSLIFGNNISFVSSVTAGRTGIRTKNAPKISIAENMIISDNSGDWQNNGISVENSEGTLIYKNHISSGTGLLATGNMLNSNYYCNTFDGYVSGIKLFSHILRPSFIAGNSSTSHGTNLTALNTDFGRSNIFLNQASWGYTIELFNCNSMQNKWAAFRHPLSTAPIPFTISNNGTPNIPSLIEFSASGRIADGCNASPEPKAYLNNDAPNAILSDNSYTVFPNPNHGQYTIEIKSDKSFLTEMAIIDITGKKVYSQEILIEEDFNRFQMNQDQLPAGIYFIKVNGLEETIKMVITKIY